MRPTRTALLPLVATAALLHACASAPPPQPDPEPTPPTAATTPDRPTPPPSRIVAASEDDTAEGEQLERMARDYTRQVEALLEARKDEVNACYLRELKRDPRLQGSFRVEFTVVSGGRIGDGPHTRDDTLRCKAVEACITNLLRGITYPQPYNGEYATIKRAFTFGAF